MKKYLEALEIIRQHLTFVDHDNEIINEYEEECNFIEKALLELKAIKEANPSEALECLERIHTDFSYRTSQAGYECLSDDELKDLETIKQTLLKAQEMKKENKELIEHIKRWHDLLLKSGIDSKGMVVFEIEEYWDIKRGV